MQPSPGSSAGPAAGRRSADNSSVHGSRPSEAATSAPSDPSYHGPSLASGEDPSAGPAVAAGSPAAPGTPLGRAGANGGMGGSTRGGSAAADVLQHGSGTVGPPDAEPDEGPDSAPSDDRLLSQVSSTSASLGTLSCVFTTPCCHPHPWCALETCFQRQTRYASTSIESAFSCHNQRLAAFFTYLMRVCWGYTTAEIVEEYFQEVQPPVTWLV